MDPLQSGLEVEIRRTRQPGIYRARVEDVDDRSLWISLPEHEGQVVVLDPGEKVHLTVYRATHPRGKFEAETEVLEKGIGRLGLKRPQVWEHHQLREYVRVPQLLRVQVERLVRGSWSRAVPATAVDLSGGGLMLHVPGYEFLRLGRGHWLRITLSLPQGVVRVAGEVVRVIPTEDGGTRYAVQFREIDERDRDRIIAYVLQEEVRQRKLMD